MRRVSRWATLSVVLLSACSLPGRDGVQLEPTRTLAPPRTVAPNPDPTQPPTPSATKAPTASAEAAPAVARRPSTPACADVKPALGAAQPVLASGDGRVYFVTTDGNIVLSDVTGTTKETVTTDGFVDQEKRALRAYQFPAASRDGGSLVFARLDIADGVASQTVEVMEAKASPKRTELYTTTEFNIPYLDWSPDGGTIAFLTINQQQGAVRAVSKTGGDVLELGVGAPTYWDWRADSTAMVTHLGGRATQQNDAHIGIVGLSGAKPQAAKLIQTPPGAFQSPQFSPNGAHMVYVALVDGADELLLADNTGKPLCAIAAVNDGAFFAWSPDGAQVAFMDTASPLSKSAPLMLADIGAGSLRQLHSSATAFFWSPDGARLAVYSITEGESPTQLNVSASQKLASPALQQGATLMTIQVVDVETAKSVLVANINPTRDFAAYLNFFDQYSRAVTPWSPNGRHLTLAGSGEQDGAPQIAVATLATDNTRVTLKQLGEGTLAFFSSK